MENDMKSRLALIWFVILLLSLPTTLVFGDGGHGDEDTAAEGADSHGDEAADAHNEGGSGFALMPLVLGIVVGGVLSGGVYASDNKRSGLLLGIIGLTVATGVLHLMPGSPLMILNGLGYLALAAALFLPLPLPENIVRMVPIILGIYTLVTIVGYFVLHTPAQYSTLGLADKAIEVVLIILLGAYLRQRQSA